jgi:hypothetical protein
MLAGSRMDISATSRRERICEQVMRGRNQSFLLKAFVLA